MGEKTEAVARELRVTARSVRRWRRAWEQGGADALRSAGPASVERLSPAQWGRLERELRRGPLAHGFGHGFQGWTLKRVKLLIGRMFHVGYTIRGVWKSPEGATPSCVGTAGPPRFPCGGPWSATGRRSRFGRPRCGRR
ncbi:hypothetical protein GCM10010094_75870 [Streptomyces flaveus]|uniref:Transposase n=1 Tax=Streptomyces flaveus TaxID=66370 RepID=A0A917REJ1_9ACTN|nr:helix-turn-helix domain-containing protein [Streptomyces flaveus]GGL03845.1 hypothetical protein GCM10010094_75870 [Streptomyces flaveus]